MVGTEFLEALSGFLEQDDLLSITKEVNELKSSFEDYIIEEERKLQVAEMEAKENQEEIDQEKELLDIQNLKEAFHEKFSAFKQAKKQQREEIDAIESKHLSEKLALIKRLKELVATEENIGAAFASLKEIQEQWKTIGEIPRAKRNEVETEYSHLLDDFFYNIKIYKELKDHDFHRNEQLKEEIIVKLKRLNNLDKIKQIESELKELQDEWNDVGPVNNERWEALKEAFWTEVRSIYNKINRFYEDRRSIQLENLKKKEVLLEELKVLLADIDGLESPKDWEKMTTKVIDIQNRWKKIGFGPKKQNDELFAELRKECDFFFEKKKDFFEDVRKDYDSVAKNKKSIIEQAAQIVLGEDKREIANQLKKLQQNWKKIGHSGPRNEQKLWKEFRAICDKFFTSLEDDRKKSAEEELQNLQLKQELIKQIEGLKLPEEKKEALNLLTDYIKKFNAIGHVPIKEKDRLFESFKKATDLHYNNLKLEESEKENVLLQAQVEMVQGGPNAGRQLRAMKDEIRKKIDHFNKEIIQLENNLGFFSNSKGADKLLKDVESRVQGYKVKIEELKRQLKMIPNE